MATIRIKLPISLGLSGALLNVIGRAWPESSVDFSAVPGEMCINVPDAPPDLDAVSAQDAVEASEAELRAIKDEAGESMVSVSSDMMFARVAAFVAETLVLADDENRAQLPDGVNYITSNVDYNGNRFVLTVSRNGRDPDSLRRKAEAELARLKAEK